MVKFETVIKKFDQQGDKTGWSYVEVPANVASKIKPGYKKSFRVMGTFDEVQINSKSLLPMGGGSFIIPIDASIRKALGKRRGALLKVSLTEDTRKPPINKTFLSCLEDDHDALEFFNSLPGSHRNYFSKWIESAKADETKLNRIARAVVALSRKQGYPEMVKADKEKRLF